MKNILEYSNCTCENKNIVYEKLIDIDFIFLAIGSPACNRNLFFQSYLEKRNKKFINFEVSKLDISMGTHTKKIEQEIEKIFKDTNLNKVLLYISCLDIIANTDYESIRDRMKKIYNKDVYIFKRGPMEKRKFKAEEKINKIKENIGLYEKIENTYNTFSLPSLSVDFSGAISSLKNTNINFLLFTPGGCTSSIRKTDLDTGELEIVNTRFTDLELSLGVENIVSESINKKYNNKERLVLLSTPITEMVGSNYEKIKSTVKDNVELIHIETNGFDTYKKGYQKLLNKEGFLRYKTLHSDKIQIFGYTDLALNNRGFLKPFIKKLEKLGYEVSFIEDDNFYVDSKIQWILTPEGEYEIQNKTNDIRRIYGLPLGNYGEYNLLRQLKDNMKDKYYDKYTSKKNENVFILGEYSTSIAIANTLSYDLGYRNITIGLFDSEYKDIKNNTSFKSEFKLEIFSIKESIKIKEMICNSDKIYSDKLIKEVFKVEKDFVVVPYRALSGKYFYDSDYILQLEDK